MTVTRQRLPNRRMAETREIAVNSLKIAATVGFDEQGQPLEVFLSGAKDGSGLAAILDDASVLISLALQYQIPVSALRKSVARVPERFDGPATAAASPIGAALDLLAELEAQR